MVYAGDRRGHGMDYDRNSDKEDRYRNEKNNYFRHNFYREMA